MLALELSLCQFTSMSSDGEPPEPKDIIAITLGTLAT